MDAHFATFKDTPMGLNDDEEPYALYVEGRVGRFSKREPKNVDLQFQVKHKKISKFTNLRNISWNQLFRKLFSEMFLSRNVCQKSVRATEKWISEISINIETYFVKATFYVMIQEYWCNLISRKFCENFAK